MSETTQVILATISGGVAILTAWMTFQITMMRMAADEKAKAEKDAREEAARLEKLAKEEVARKEVIAAEEKARQAAIIAEQVRLVAFKAEEVKAVLAETQSRNDKALIEAKVMREETFKVVLKTASVSHDTHVLVNSNMGVQLKMNAELSRWKAGQTGKAEDAAAADRADDLLREHEEGQKIVDAGKPK